MSLPKWVRTYYTNDADFSNLHEALAIAWEALEKNANQWTEFLRNPTIGSITAREALRRIEELGK